MTPLDALVLGLCVMAVMPGVVFLFAWGIQRESERRAELERRKKEAQ